MTPEELNKLKEIFKICLATPFFRDILNSDTEAKRRIEDYKESIKDVNPELYSSFSENYDLIQSDKFISLRGFYKAIHNDHQMQSKFIDQLSEDNQNELGAILIKLRPNILPYQIHSAKLSQSASSSVVKPAPLVHTDILRAAISEHPIKIQSLLHALQEYDKDKETEKVNYFIKDGILEEFKGFAKKLSQHLDKTPELKEQFHKMSYSPVGKIYNFILENEALKSFFTDRDNFDLFNDFLGSIRTMKEYIEETILAKSYQAVSASSSSRGRARSNSFSEKRGDAPDTTLPDTAFNSEEYQQYLKARHEDLEKSVI